MKIRSIAVAGGVLGISMTLAACGSSSSNPVTAPSTPPATATPTSTAVRLYLEEFVRLMETNSMHRKTIDWAAVRRQVTEAGAGAQTIREAFRAIEVGLSFLNDNHSFYDAVDGTRLRGAPRTCAGEPVTTPVLPSELGYVRITGFLGAGAAADEFAAGITTAIRQADKPGLAGWIVDLRGNTGGNMFPMLAGVGSILGGGTSGFLVDPEGVAQAWRYDNGGAFLEQRAIFSISSPYRLIASNPKVAVLIDNATVSSGEAITVSFHRRPNTRLFGAATCGASSATAGYQMSDRATLFIAGAWMANREGTKFGGPIEPDERAATSDIIDRAVTWIRTR
jgi:carboxyl-terminal processing protease